MKHLNYLYFALILAVVLSGCASRTPIITGSRTQTPTAPSTPVFSTSTVIPAPTRTATLTPPVTLEARQAQTIILELLREPEVCPAPCFWGIMPGTTTYGEAKNIFTRLGLQLRHTNTEGEKDFYSLIYDFSDGLRLSPVLTVQSDIVTNTNIGIVPEGSRKGVPREWFAYSPETLIERYGQPSRIEFSIANPPDSGEKRNDSYYMTMYFDGVNLIVLYEEGEALPPVTSLRACPVTDQFTAVRVWLGPDPQYPPHMGVPLEKAASITVEQFSKLIVGPPEKACIDLNREAFQ